MNKTVLLVEDSKVQKLQNERILHKAGYSVLTADDGEQALRLAHEKIPDLILLDMLLPKLGGPEVLHALKQDQTTARIPVIVLSSLSQTNSAKLKGEGAADYFEKSRLTADELGAEAFVETVARVLRQSEAKNAAAAAVADSLKHRH